MNKTCLISKNILNIIYLCIIGEIMEIDEKYLALQEFLRCRDFNSQEEKDRILMEFETMPEEDKKKFLEKAKRRLKYEKACNNVKRKYEKELNKFNYFYNPEYYKGGNVIEELDDNIITGCGFVYKGGSIKLKDSDIRIYYDNEDNKVEAIVDFSPADPDDEEDYGTGVEHSSMENVLKLLKFIHKHPTKPLKYCIDAVYS